MYQQKGLSNILRMPSIIVPGGSVCNQDKWSKPFLRADQGIKVTAELRKLKDQGHMVPIRPLTCKKSSDQAHIYLIKNLDPGCKRIKSQHISDHPLIMEWCFI